MSTRDGGERIRLARALFPDLAARLDRALVEHREAEGAHADDAFDTWLDAETETLRGEMAGMAFAEVGDERALQRFEESLAAARAVADAGRLVVPQPETFAAAGADLARLGHEAANDPTLMLVPAPYGLGADGWRSLFAAVAAESGGSLVEGAAAAPLVLGREAEQEFELLDRVPEGVPRVESGAAAPGGGARWTLRLVPAGLAPAVLGQSYDHGAHATLPEMLMLQLMRAVSGEPLVDARSFTWLSGLLADGRLAARHVYDRAERTVRINCQGIGNQGPHLGSRPPIG